MTQAEATALSVEVRLEEMSAALVEILGKHALLAAELPAANEALLQQLEAHKGGLRSLIDAVRRRLRAPPLPLPSAGHLV